MARARNIKPSFFTNEKLAELPFSVRLLFIGLWTMCDRSGRMEDRPKRIKMNLFPADRVDVNKGLEQLAADGFIIRYVVDNERYITIPNFEKHQNPHCREADSTIPAPDEHSASTVRATLIPDSLQSDSLQSDSPRDDTHAQVPALPGRIDAVDAQRFGYPLDDLFRRFPDLVITPSQMGLIVAKVKDTDIDKAAWLETMELYSGNHDPTKNRYDPRKVGTIIQVFQKTKTRIEQQQGNGSHGTNQRRNSPDGRTDADVLRDSASYLDAKYPN